MDMIRWPMTKIVSMQGWLTNALGQVPRTMETLVEGPLRIKIEMFLNNHSLNSNSLKQTVIDTNEYLKMRYEPWEIILWTMVIMMVLRKVVSLWHRAKNTWREKGWKQVISGILFDIPGIRGIVEREEGKNILKLRTSMQRQKAKMKSVGGLDTLLSLPRDGISASSLKSRLERRAKDDILSANKMSGCIYMGGSAHRALLNQVYSTFALTNPLHSDAFPSVRQMEAEVVAMTASLLGGGPAGVPEVCGAMTGGGTESILTAVLASRNYMSARKGITHPEMIIADSAHAAYFKAAEYFCIRLIRVPVNSKDYRLYAKQVSRYINKNTILVVASAPGFPHGVIDDVEGISNVCQRRNILLHVDCCLGGFFLPFARDIGYPIKPFDFSLRGVTSISVDTHKFGQAHKGTSVVLYRSPELRHYQYTKITEWSGGLYISPGFAGSRSGALIATAWASIMHLGRNGFVEATKRMMELSQKMQDGIEAIDGLQVVGKPDANVVAFKSTSKELNIWKVNDLMSKKGWHLNALQRPAAVHMCFTAAHTPDVVDNLLIDIKECVQEVLAKRKSNTGDDDGGLAPLYGQAAIIPDRRIVGRFLTAYQDMMLEVE